MASTLDTLQSSIDRARKATGVAMPISEPPPINVTMLMPARCGWRIEVIRDGRHEIAELVATPILEGAT